MKLVLVNVNSKRYSNFLVLHILKTKLIYIQKKKKRMETKKE